MKHTMRFTKLLFIALTLFIAVSCDGDDDNDNVIDENDTTIADFVTDNEDYSSLLTALQLTGLDATLAGSGTFTVFAPNNAAFDAYLGDTALEDVDTDVLTELLLNHVLSESLDASELASVTNGYVSTLATEASTSANISMYVDATSGVVLNGQSTVTTADIETDNGVIHAVDTVIELPTVVTFATTNPALTSLLAALTREETFTYATTLGTENGTDPAPFTVFAPTDDAFTDLIADLVAAEILPEGATLADIPTETLAATLELHVLTGVNVRAEDLAGIDGTDVTTLNGADITIDATTPAIIDPDEGSSTIVITDIQAANGVVHVIDRVLRDL